MEIDLNCDLGEGSGHDAELMPLITSASVACGAHAGDLSTARATLALAAKYGVRAGAHPGFPDPESFGRREMERAEPQVFLDCVQQIFPLAELAAQVLCPLRYVKAHGGLYNLACRNAAYARPVVTAAALFGLPLVGLPASVLQETSNGRCDYIPEGFADRRYQPDGSLVPRNRADAIIDDAGEAVWQVDRLIRERGVRTICVHGDNPRAVAFIKALRDTLTRRGFQIQAFA